MVHGYRLDMCGRVCLSVQRLGVSADGVWMCGRQLVCGVWPLVHRVDVQTPVGVWGRNQQLPPQIFDFGVRWRFVV